MNTGRGDLAEIYEFHRGEPIALGDRLEAGDPTGLTLRARIKRIKPGRGDEMPGPNTPVAATFTTTFTPAAGAEKAFWLHSLTPAQSLALVSGRYCFDSAVMQGDQVLAVTAESVILIKNAASS